MRFQEAITALNYKREKKFTLVGAEPFLKELFVRMVKKLYSDAGITEFFPENQREALALLGSESFFGEQVVILNDFNKMKMENFGSTISSFGGCIILIMAEKANMSSREATTATGNTVIVECNKLRDYGSDYPLWIKNQIQEAGYAAAEGIEDTIFQRIGPNMYILSNELEKLFIMKTDKTILPDDVNKIVSHTAVSTSFDLFENLMKRDIARALRCFSSYSRSSQDSLADIVGFMGSYFEKMYRMLLLREQKFEIDDIADIVGIPRFLVKTRYMPKALIFGKDRLASKINSLCELDVQLRTFKGDKHLLFEKFILGFSISN